MCVCGEAVCAQPSALARRSFSLQPRGLFVVALPIFGTSFFRGALRSSAFQLRFLFDGIVRT